MPDQNKLDKTYLKMASIWADMSHAKRKKVGCIIVKEDQIISDGYNGTPAGFDNKCEQFHPSETFCNYASDRTITKKEVLHAESNALMKLAKSNNSSDGATMYLTCSPCFDCAKLIIQAGISKVYYSEDYRDMSGVALLETANIEVEQVNVWNGI